MRLDEALMLDRIRAIQIAAGKRIWDEGDRGGCDLLSSVGVHRQW
jgi:hypothetical protein